MDLQIECGFDLKTGTPHLLANGESRKRMAGLWCARLVRTDPDAPGGIELEFLPANASMTYEICHAGVYFADSIYGRTAFRVAPDGTIQVLGTSEDMDWKTLKAVAIEVLRDGRGRAP